MPHFVRPPYSPANRTPRAPQKFLNKEKVNYENKAPRCQYCANFVKPWIKLTTDSRTVRIQPQCKVMYGFVSENGLCDLWVSAADGSTLEPPPESKEKTE